MIVPAATLPIAPPTRPVVLLIEDDDPVRELIARALRANGFEVVAAASGEEALDLELGRHVDLHASHKIGARREILSGLNSYGSTGLEAA